MQSHRTLFGRILVIVCCASWLVLALFTPVEAAPPIPKQVVDLNTTGSDPYTFGKPVEFNGAIYARLHTLPYGYELWRIDATDGAAESTLVGDIYPGSNDGAIGDPFVAGNVLYFEGDDGSGSELWRYDGTTLTEIEINPTTVDHGYSRPEFFAVVGDTLYVSAFDGTDRELWVIIGTTATKFDLNPAPEGYSFPQLHARVNDTLYVTINPGTFELWAIAGTTATKLVSSFSYMSLTIVGDSLYVVTNDGTFSLWHVIGATPTKIDIFLDYYSGDLTAVGNALYLRAGQRSDEVDDQELWQVIGTTLTEIDINPDGSSSPSSLTAAGDTLYMLANDGTGNSLWQVTGTTPTKIAIPVSQTFYNPVILTAMGNTLYVVVPESLSVYGFWSVTGATPTRIDIPGFHAPQFFTTVENILYVYTYDGTTSELWGITGTNATKISIPPPQILTVVGNMLYGSIYNGTNYELWVISGTDATNLNVPLGSFFDASRLTVVGSTLYLRTYEDTSGSLWQVIGTIATKIDLGADGSQYPNSFFALGNRLWLQTYSGSDTQYFLHQGNTLTPIDVPYGASSTPQSFVMAGENLYFVAFDGTDTGLWRYDGTATTKIDLPGDDFDNLTAVRNALYLLVTNKSIPELWQVIDSVPTKIDLPGGNPHNLVAVGNALYMVIDDLSGRKLWQVIGTTLTKIDLQPDGSASPSSLTAVDNTLYLVAYDGTGNSLWQVIGTLPTKIATNPSDSFFPTNLTAVGNTLYLTSHGTTDELWQINGTTTTKVAIPGPASHLAALGSTVYLVIDDDAGDSLWQIVGTTPTKIDIDHEGVPSLLDLAVASNSLYLVVYGNGTSILWHIAGTTATKININPLPGGSSNPEGFVVVGNRLYVSAFDGAERELWQVSGTTATEYDIFAGSGSGQVTNLYAAANRLVFAAWHNITSGSEVWIMEHSVPTSTHDIIVTTLDLPVQHNVLANDQGSGGEVITVAGFSQPTHGQTTLAANGDIVYTPAAGFTGVDSFSYTASNGFGLTDTATAFVVVKPASTNSASSTVIVTSLNATATQTITHQGFTIAVQVPANTYSGTLNVDDTLFFVYTPFNSFSSNVENAPGSFRFAGLNFTLEGYLNNAALETASFDPPLLLEITYPASAIEGMSQEALTLLYWDSESNSWASDGVQIVAHDIENRKMTVALSHLTEFALFVQEAKQFLPTLSR